jgi:hypothetical protein
MAIPASSTLFALRYGAVSGKNQTTILPALEELEGFCDFDLAVAHLRVPEMV